MREIIFRGKMNTGRWAYGSLILAGSYCCILETDDNVRSVDYTYLDNETGCIDGYAAPVIPESVGQWTGLVDKNGTKIFEGDIVSIYGKHRSVEFDTKYAEFEFCMKDPVRNPEGEALCSDHNLCEVIGNIHDNPELLEAR